MCKTAAMQVSDQGLCTWCIPGVHPETNHELVALAAGVTVIVGANGSGKSALGYWLQTNATSVVVRRLIAHRRLWFESSGPDITAATRGQLKANMDNWSRQPDSRWLDHANPQRAGAVLFDLLAKVNERNARVAAFVDEGVSRERITEEIEPSLLARVNAVLRKAHLEIELAITDQGGFDAVSGSGSRYPISQMSDGEKSALLLAAEVLTAPERCVQVIDEPERHLHRSISAGLIEAVLAERPDCHFVVLTHDLELAGLLSAESAQMLVLSRCVWAGLNATGWDLHSVGADETVPDIVRAAILGGKNRLLFVEGEAQSLDSRLYSILFPGWGLSPIGGCEQVIRAVVGLATSTAYHWVEGRGIVDRDGRSEAECAALGAKGILVLPVHEIESLYYLPQLLGAMAERQAAALERDAAELSRSVLVAAVKALGGTGTPERLASAVAAQIVARTAVESLPDANALASGAEEAAFRLASPFPALLSQLQQLLVKQDLDQLVRRFPIRETALRTEVSKALGFREPGDYEAAIRSRLRADAELVATLRGVVGPLP
jgi:ABC-type oligopeptide transport system ATPase subunit